MLNSSRRLIRFLKDTETYETPGGSMYWKAGEIEDVNIYFNKDQSFKCIEIVWGCGQTAQLRDECLFEILGPDYCKTCKWNGAEFVLQCDKCFRDQYF